MAITVHLSEVLKARNMTSKELCAKVGITEANLSILRSGLQKLCAWDERREVTLLSPSEVVYCESVDDHTFLYTSAAVYQTALSLAELEGRYGSLGLFRAGKSSIVNLHRVRALKSQPGGRIEVTLETEERLVVSRHYAPLLRERLGL